jgi:hypothetical protein
MEIDAKSAHCSPDSTPPPLAPSQSVHDVIHLHPAAPDKPAAGQPCNGCGVCCASAPCPLGIVASGRVHGRCRALVWNDAAGLYRCGLIERPAHELPAASRWLAPLLAQAARRYIASGSGCDCELVVERADVV